MTDFAIYSFCTENVNPSTLSKDSLNIDEKQHKYKTCNTKKEDVQLVFEDEGPGFNEKDINKVFNRFYSNRPEKFGEHSGLGLNIVKNIIELHGGSVKASNQQGKKKGARIEVLLPISQ